MATADYHSPAGGAKSFFKQLRKMLRERLGSRLQPLLRSVCTRTGQLPELNDDIEIERVLVRLGIIRKKNGSSGRGQSLNRAIGLLAEESGSQLMSALMILRLFGCGEDLLKLEPICGEMPVCRSCLLSGECRYYSDLQKKPEPAPSERPAKRLRNEGEEALTATDLISLILGGRGPSEATALALARSLVGQCGSLRDLAALPLGELEVVGGMNADLAIRLRAALALARRWNIELRNPGRQFSRGGDFYDFFHTAMIDRKKESFFIVLLDQKNRYISSEMVSVGTLTGALVHPREVFRPAMQAAAAAIAFVHNHPSGNPQPSRDDREITARLLEVGKLLGIRVLDHVIIGENSYFSFVEEGLI
jgi:DNA repair protein RadC